MSEKNKGNFQGFAIATLLATDSGLWNDFNSLDPENQNEENLKELIRHNLYNKGTGVQNGQVVTQPPNPSIPEIEQAITVLNYTTLVANRELLAQSAKIIGRRPGGVISALMDYDPGGSCPGYALQPEMYKAMVKAGSDLP